jgi:hypothetical protein
MPIVINMETSYAPWRVLRDLKFDVGAPDHHVRPAARPLLKVLLRQAERRYKSRIPQSH